MRHNSNSNMPHKSEIISTSNSYESVDFSWNDLVAEFTATAMASALERIGDAERLRSKFVSDFPIKKIQNMTPYDYLISPKGKDNDASFCMRLRYELAGTAHMGNAFPSVFGAYLRNGNTLVLSPTLYKEFGSNTHAALESIKEQIVQLLIAADQCNYNMIAKCSLNSLFKYKLLTVYFPDKYIPVCAKETLKGYCNAVGMMYSDSEDMIFHNIALLQWKNTHPPFCEWKNSLFMLFCDWLWRKNSKQDS